jgi:drug/metabolite transporter (DMT)-like permease
MIKKLRGSIMLLLASIIWGTTFVAQSDGMNYIAPFTFNALRTLLGGIVLMPVMILFRHFGINNDKSLENKASVSRTVEGGIVCGIVLFLASSFQQFGISMTTVGKAGFITALYVVIVPIISLILGNRISLKIFVCVLVAIVGFYLLCINEGFSIDVGDLLVLICSFLFAVHIIVIDRFNSEKTDAILMSCVQFLTAGSLMLICMFIFETPALDNICAAKYSIMYAGIMSCAVAYTLQIIGQKTTDPTAATLIMSLESVFAAVSGWLILSEKLSLKEISGCVLVFAAVILVQLDSLKKTKEN